MHLQHQYQYNIVSYYMHENYINIWIIMKAIDSQLMQYMSILK